MQDDNKEKFIKDFVKIWTKIMSADMINMKVKLMTEFTSGISRLQRKFIQIIKALY